MALEGSLSEFGLADILQLIYFQRKTGILTLDGRVDKVRISFYEGKIVGAESKRRKDDARIGKILLKKGLISEADLQSALDENSKTGLKLGSILLKRGLAEKEAISEILSTQISEAVTQLFTWKQGTYEFVVQGITQDKDLHISLDTQHVLMEGLRIVDEWSIIKGKITLDTIYRLTGEKASGLTPVEQEILSHVNGENDVASIVALSSADEFETSSALVSLQEKGVIETVAAKPVEQGPAEAAHAGIGGVLKFAAPLSVILSLLLSTFMMVAAPKDALKVFQASKTVDNLRRKAEIYMFEHSRYPASLDVIYNGKDPWGRDYIYILKNNFFSISSAGPDATPGTEDDIY